MLKEAFAALQKAQRPVLIFGAGIRLAGAGELARDLARMLRIPVAPTWGARDLFPASELVDLADVYGYLCVGGFGTHGTRAANFAVQNADWILCVGARLDSKATGTPRHYFARGADIFMADIDAAEIRKFGGVLGRSFTGVQADAKLFLQDALREVAAARASYPSFFEWRVKCAIWCATYPVGDGSDAYTTVRALSQCCRSEDVIVSDTGLSLAWLMQAFEFKPGQQFIHALNQTPMGYGLPAAIGAVYAAPGRRVVLVTGDGGFMLNIQELALIGARQLPVKIVVLNNGGHGMCRQTQDQWLGKKYYSTTPPDLMFPNFGRVAEAFGLKWACVKPGASAAKLAALLDEWFDSSGPVLLDVAISPASRLVPQVPYGCPNEDGSPHLSREELEAQMIVGVI